MDMKFGHSLFLTLLAIIFAVGLTFASIELPRLADSLLKDKLDYPGFDSRANESNIFTAELYIQHYHIRLIDQHKITSIYLGVNIPGSL